MKLSPGKLLDAMGCPTDFKGGGVTISLSGDTLRNRAFVRDCYRFSQVVYLLGKSRTAREELEGPGGRIGP